MNACANLNELGDVRQCIEIGICVAERLQWRPVGEVVQGAQRVPAEVHEKDEVVGGGERQQEHTCRRGRAVAQQHEERERVARHAHCHHHREHVHIQVREHRPPEQQHVVRVARRRRGRVRVELPAARLRRRRCRELHRRDRVRRVDIVEIVEFVELWSVGNSVHAKDGKRIWKRIYGRSIKRINRSDKFTDLKFGECRSDCVMGSE
jgi:hypothetical protein